MPIHGASSDVACDIAPEDRLRGQLYGLLAKFLSEPPSKSDLASASNLEGDNSELGKAITTLARLSAQTTPDVAREEFHDLFIGVARGELLPYASYYLTGFLHEKPLAKLRVTMAELGIAHDPNVSEPEDHIAAISEMMAGLIEGRFGEPASLDVQRTFFEGHLSSWAPYFYRDLEAANSSVLYAAVGAVGRKFLDIEDTAFAMA